MIEFQGVSKSYGELGVLENFSLILQTGEVVAVVGPSGCGKTTILRLATALSEPNAGRILIDSKSPLELRRNGAFGYVPQAPCLLPWLTVQQNIELSLDLLRIRDRRDSVSSILSLLGLLGFETFFPHELSGGMQQRVALARALIHRPQILILDEPFAAVDELLRERLDRELADIAEQLGITVLLVTHSVAEAAYLSDRVVVLSERPARVRGIVKVLASRPRRQLGKEGSLFETVQEIRCLLDN